ncbi:MAG: HAMP domain-containing histidine kinase [Candidatus Omnitrophica bacterium]|nr:HAMP domain-containing histidine kinase [Candidatus Omnitrophota bacterium]
MMPDIFIKNLDIVFFIYGFSFVFMGVAVLSQPRRESMFSISKILWILAAFGLTHGLNEWLDMFAIIRGGHSNTFNLIRLTTLFVSYVFLFEFGRRCISLRYKKFFNKWITVGLCFLTLAFVFVSKHEKSICIRYFLGFPGGILSAFGFAWYYRDNKSILNPIMRCPCFIAAGFFMGIYAILGGIVTPKADFFPASIINSTSFLNLFHVPVQVFRAVCAIVLAWSVWKILAIFNWEIKERLESSMEEASKAKRVAEIASKTKSQFLANMSHELRTPLNAIIGFSEVLKDESFGSLNDKQKEYANDILKSGEHLLSLINDILDLSKVEAGKIELRLTEFNLKTAIENILSMIKEKAMKQNIHISLDLKEDTGIIKADERRVKQIMFNLLSNAVKFTPDGGKIGIEAKLAEDKVLISVWDTGIGIEEKDRDKIFKEFEQIDSEYARKYTGTGLGLALTKKLVGLHGGRIWFESGGKDKGSRFSFTLPRG